MNSKLMIGLIGASGLVAGILAGQQFAAQGAAEKSVPQVKGPAQAERGSGRLSTSASSRKEKHDLSRLMRIMRNHYASGDPEAVREIERLNTRELQSLIEELVRSRPLHHSAENKAIGVLIKAAVKEWYRRDGEKALQQAEQLDDEETREMVLSQLINAAVSENPELGKQWADRFRAENGKDWYRFVVMEAVQGAISRSADDFLKVKELFKGEDVGFAGHDRFVEDFDFGKVVAAVPVGDGAENMMSRWAAEDPDAAWDMAKKMVGEHGERAGSHVGSVFRGISMVKGDGEAAGWLADHIGELPEEARRSVFQSLRSVDFLSPERASAVMTALSGKDERVTFASVLLDPYHDSGTGLAGLRALDSEASRVGALMATARKYAPGMGNGSSDHSIKVHGYFDRTMEEVGLPPEVRETVKAALAPPVDRDER